MENKIDNLAKNKIDKDDNVEEILNNLQTQSVNESIEAIKYEVKSLDEKFEQTSQDFATQNTEKIQNIHTNINLSKDEILNNLSKKGYKINTIEKEKGNFSHMLNGDRKFSYPYIIALEEVLETSLANIINQIDEHVITPKGFEYVASQNDYELFKALDEEEDIYKFSVLKNKDEYDKTVIDYIIEYKTNNELNKFFAENINHQGYVASVSKNKNFRFYVFLLPLS